MTTDLEAMQRAVQRHWTPESHWHIGDLAWQRPSLPARTVKLWPELDAWAAVSPPGHLELQAPPDGIDAAAGGSRRRRVRHDHRAL